MIVMKFGGSSVKDADRMKNVAEIVKSAISKKPVVVVSALGGITDKLIDAANKAAKGINIDKEISEIKQRHYTTLEGLKLSRQIVDSNLNEFAALLIKIASAKEVNLRVMDHIQSFGERMSSKILAAYISSIGTKAKAFSAWDVGMITTSDFGRAEPLEESYKEMNAIIKSLKEIPIITGFIGKTEEGQITTLGRGGSDYTAAIVGAAIDADEIQIWTDVDGVMTADPRHIKTARTISELSFAEASEIAYFGAKVLHPKTILPAMKKDIPVRILNTYNPAHKGTVIISKGRKTKEIIKAVSCKRNITMLSIESSRMLGAHGFLARVFDIFEEYGTSVDMVATSEVSISLTIDDEKKLDSIIRELKEIANVRVLKNKAIVCAVGEGLKNSTGASGKILSLMGKNKVNIEMISQGASEINLAFVLDMKDVEKAISALHKEFFG